MRKVGAEARARLVREATLRDLVPESRDQRLNNAVEIAFAENATQPLDVFRAFSNLVFAGITPPPDLLIPIAEYFRAYMDAAGALSLDEACSLQGVQKAGNPFERERARAQRGESLYLIWRLRKQAIENGSELSIEKAAGDVINALDLEVSEGTLARDYSTKRTEEIMDRALEAIRWASELSKSRE